MRVRRSGSGVSLEAGDDMRLLIEERLPAVTNSRIKRHRNRNINWLVGGLTVVIVVSFILLVSYFRELKTTGGDYDPSPLSERQIRVDGSSVYAIGVVSDLDHDSLHSSGNKWFSYFKKGELVVSADLKKVSIRWSDNKDITMESDIAAGGRAMELSDLVVFNHRLLTIDDRTGLIYEISNGTAIPWVFLADGPGNVKKPMKGEWMTVKDNELWVGGLGKEWSTPQGEFINDHPMWVKVVDRTGRVRHVRWTNNYRKLRTAAGIKSPGYMVHESVQWSPFHEKWFFLPRRASLESYNDVADEKRGTNMLIDASEDFESIYVTRVGQEFYEGTKGFSAFQFIPHTDDSLIIALKSEEIDGKSIASYVTVFDTSGQIILEDRSLKGKLKFEGLAFV